MTIGSAALRHLILSLGLSAAFALSVAFSVTLTRETNGIETIWLATGFLAAGLMLLPRAWSILMAAVCLLVNVSIQRAVGDSWAAAISFPLVYLGEAIAAAWLTRLACGPGVRLTNFRQVARLMVMALLPAAGAFSVLAANLCTFLGRSFDGVLASWFFADALGMALVVPAVLLVRQPRRGFERSLAEKIGVYALVAAVTAIAFSYTRLPLQLLLFPVATFAAFRLGPRGAGLASLLMAAVSLACVAGHPTSGLNPGWTMPERIRLLQLMIALVFFTSLATAMALSHDARTAQLLASRSRMAHRAQRRALAATKAKAEFLATMSHEIRTPMNSILGFTQVLLKRDDLADPARRQLSLIERAGASLLTVVNDILDFSKVEAGQVDLALKPSSPRQVAQDAMAIVAEAARRKGLALDLTLGGEANQAVMLDDLRVRQVLLNLLANAIKFTDEGRVRLDVDAAPIEGGLGLRFAVSDTGVGIAADKIGLLFRRFSQVDSSTTRAFGGAGLGLAISKGLVELMGGRIGVESVLHEGSTFTVEIPAQVAIEPAPESTPLPQAEAPTTGPAGRILLVDDHDVNRELGVTVLSLLGCEVETASNGMEALVAARTGDYDVILMDVHMPVMDGLAATRAIRALGGDIARIPIIAMSADVMPDMVEKCRAAGMVDAVSKPISITALHAMLERWVGRDASTEQAA